MSGGGGRGRSVSPAPPPRPLSGGDTPSVCSSLVVALCLSYLCGLLAVDAVFDSTDDPGASHGYYCALLRSLSRWPQVLRVAAPIALAGVLLLRSLAAVDLPQLGSLGFWLDVRYRRCSALPLPIVHCHAAGGSATVW
jgi:hypothetical protein